MPLQPQQPRNCEVIIAVPLRPTHLLCMSGGVGADLPGTEGNRMLLDDRAGQAAKSLPDNVSHLQQC